MRSINGMRRDGRGSLWRAGFVLLLLLTALPATGAPARDRIRPVRSPMGEALRSALVPGWAQHRMGEPHRGWAYFGGALVGLVFAADLVPLSDRENSQDFLRVMGGLGYVFSATLAATDAYALAGERNRENGYELGFALPPPPGGVGQSAPLIRICLWHRRF